MKVRIRSAARRWVGTAGVVAAAVAAVFVLTGGGAKQPTGVTYRAVFDNAFGLTVGSNVTVSAVKAGEITSFKLLKTFPPKSVVSLKITQPGFAVFHKDAVCRIRQQSLIGEYYVDCQPGTAPGLMPHGGTIPVQQTSSTIPLDLIQDVLRLPYRERLRIIINELGTGLAGRPQELSEVLQRADPGLRETVQTLDILANQRQVIKTFISESNTVLRELARRRSDVARWVVAARRTSEISAGSRDALAAGFHRLPTFLSELRPTMAQLQATADRQIPLLRALQGGAPALDQFLTQLGPFAQHSRPALRSLGRASVTGRRALLSSGRDVAELRRLAASSPGAAKPLRQFLQTLDTRSRSPEPDPRAAPLAPPPPDPTADAKGKGFTGFEDFWNYIYLQTLGINDFDQLGHSLRVGLLQQNDCAPYSVNPTKAIAAECGAYLGPSQPGILGQPDPTPPVPPEFLPPKSGQATRTALDFLLK
jgi:virulence factor Mce-like protein